MFERYTERARRVVFFARYEASQFGSPTIETEHLLLGLAREDRELLRKLGPDITGDEVRKRVQERLTIREKVSTSIDLPLSPECKRILAFAAEESERLAHRYIGTEHLLLGMLRESGCGAARVLEGFGVALDSTREVFQKVESADAADDVPLSESDRSHIHGLVDRLPESALSWVTSAMEGMLARRSPERLLEAARALIGMHGLQEPKPDVSGNIAEGRFSQSRIEDAAVVVETQQFHHGHQIFITERFRMSEDGKTLSYSQEVVGPRPEQRHRHAMEFNVE